MGSMDSAALILVAGDQQVPEQSEGQKRNRVHGPADVSAFGFRLEKGN